MFFNQASASRFQLDEHSVELENCSIFYTQGGLKSDSVPILFLHGWGISAVPYHEVLNLLAQHHFVIAPDLPSFARSPYPNLIADYDGYAKFLLSFLDALNLQQVHLVGHSLGGGIAITLSALAPDRVKSVVLVDSTGIPTVSIPEIVPRRAIEMTAQLLLPRLRLKLVDIPQVFTYNLLFNTGNVIQALLLSLQVDLKHLLPKIEAPCLLLWSEKDLTEPMSVAREMAALIPDSRLAIVEEGWHEWGLWYPQKFTSLILDFVHQVERTDAVAMGRF
ncbi:alpha/beta hydrolase [Nodosilinea sp. LEGE 06152]|uniref:alpha/beta fold hydrolase n=1 Tax=Nodosilinea sp. LEGE 06152 TaxID=2777966 RepID=UPI001880BB61|nr:alpha/beta hydrolase [Nodosilinea sp. LEGE 06152]MBE9155967.1 alpha/beta hydrolase [Nodosilinea sp. LEGE 06152]